MPTTPILALPYPAASDPADVPTDMNELATRIETVRGAANGLAALGADGKVPTAQLPAAASVTVPLVTALPGSPTDGQEVILVDTLTNPAYQWRFRYNAGSTSAYKWEFVGGTPYHGSAAETAMSHPTPGTWLGATPVLSLPRAGDYMFTFSTFAQSTTAAQLFATIDLNNVGRSDWQVGMFATLPAEMSMGRASLFGAGLAAGTSVNISTYASVASQPYSRRHLSILPVRIS